MKDDDGFMFWSGVSVGIVLTLFWVVVIVLLMNMKVA